MNLIFNIKLRLINKLPKKLQERYLEYLSGDEDWIVRYNVARHTNTPAHVLEKLSEDEDFMVRNNAKENLKKKKILTNLWSNVKSS